MIGVLTNFASLVSGSVEFSIIAKATVVLIAGLATAALARRARASMRHLVLAVTFAALAILPMAMIALPPLTVDLPAPALRMLSNPPQARGANGCVTGRSTNRVKRADVRAERRSLMADRHPASLGRRCAPPGALFRRQRRSTDPHWPEWDSMVGNA